MTAPTEFQWIASEVAAGRLSMDPEQAGKVVRLIDDYIHELKVLMDRGNKLIRLDAYGAGSARLLGKKFVDLASSTNPKSGSWVAACQQRIDLMHQMRAVFANSFKAVEATDQQLAGSLHKAGALTQDLVKGS